MYGEDPTVNWLEARAAEMFGREAALLVPTGSMGNQVAIKLHTQHGQEVVCEARAHVLDWEMGMTAEFSGCTLRGVWAERGMLTWELVRGAIFQDVHFHASTGLICIENTHMCSGGTVMPAEVAREICEGAHGLGLPVHLDGARVFNAAAALGVGVRELTAGFDTVMFCLSKGLGAPVGSMLVGSAVGDGAGTGDSQGAGRRDAAGRRAGCGGVDRAGGDAGDGWLRTMQCAAAGRGGGAVRGCGDRSGDGGDEHRGLHAAARRGCGGVLRGAEGRGVLAGALGPRVVRLVTHYDVGREDCERAAEAVGEALEGWELMCWKRSRSADHPPFTMRP